MEEIAYWLWTSQLGFLNTAGIILAFYLWRGCLLWLLDRRSMRRCRQHSTAAWYASSLACMLASIALASLASDWAMAGLVWVVNMSTGQSMVWAYLLTLAMWIAYCRIFEPITISCWEIIKDLPWAVAEFNDLRQKLERDYYQ